MSETWDILMVLFWIRNIPPCLYLMLLQFRYDFFVPSSCLSGYNLCKTFNSLSNLLIHLYTTFRENLSVAQKLKGGTPRHKPLIPKWKWVK
jgi:hypothetical protein